MPKWRNWQTRYVQGVVGVCLWGFKSPLRHQVFNWPIDRLNQSLVYRIEYRVTETKIQVQGHNPLCPYNTLLIPGRHKVCCTNLFFFFLFHYPLYAVRSTLIYEIRIKFLSFLYIIRQYLYYLIHLPFFSDSKSDKTIV